MTPDPLAGGGTPPIGGAGGAIFSGGVGAMGGGGPGGAGVAEGGLAGCASAPPAASITAAPSINPTRPFKTALSVLAPIRPKRWGRQWVRAAPAIVSRPSPAAVTRGPDCGPPTHCFFTENGTKPELMSPSGIERTTQWS